MGTTYRFQAAHLHAMTRRLFMAAGTPRHIADDVAEILVNSNLAGHDSHGVLRIPAYLRGQSGREGANLRATQQAWPRTIAFLRQHTR